MQRTYVLTLLLPQKNVEILEYCTSFFNRMEASYLEELRKSLVQVKRFFRIKSENDSCRSLRNDLGALKVNLADL